MKELLEEIKKIREALEYQNKLIETLMLEKPRLEPEDMMKKMETMLSKTLGEDMSSAVLKEISKIKKGL